MSSFIQSFWQANIEFSLLLTGILLARYAVRKGTRTYNAYLLWLSIPVGLLVALITAQIELSKPPVETVNLLVQSYIVQPVATFDGWLLVAWIWVTITVLLLVRLLQQHLDLRRELANITVAEIPELRSDYPVIGIDKENFSPAVYGFWRPRIFFPLQLHRELPLEQQKLIIQHEEHHISQRHLWLNLLWDIAVCCLWFNPLIYISRQSFRHDQELFCDYLVLNQTQPQAHQAYGLALLTTVSATHSVSLLCSWKTFNQLEERIMNIKKPTSLSSKILMVLGGSAIVAATSFYTVSAAEYRNGDPVIIESEPHDESHHTSNGYLYHHEHDAHESHADSHDEHEYRYESFRHEVDDDGSTEISWSRDGTMYVSTNGEGFVFEGDEKRPMTEEERLKLEQKVEDSQRRLAEQQLHRETADKQRRTAESERRKAESERRKAERKREKAEREHQREELAQERRQREMERAQLQMEREQERQEREMARYEKQTAERERIQEREMERHQRALELQERILEEQELMLEQHQLELEQAELSIEEARQDLKQSYSDGDISELALRKADAELKAARRGLERDRANLLRDTKRAREDMERARKRLNKKAVHLSEPVSPRPVVAPRPAVEPRIAAAPRPVVASRPAPAPQPKPVPDPLIDPELPVLQPVEPAAPPAPTASAIDSQWRPALFQSTRSQAAAQGRRQDVSSFDTSISH
ncbi:MAG: M56 family metallopeptidase [Pseudomonadota bacterium]